MSHRDRSLRLRTVPFPARLPVVQPTQSTSPPPKLAQRLALPPIPTSFPLPPIVLDLTLPFNRQQLSRQAFLLLLHYALSQGSPSSSLPTSFTFALSQGSPSPVIRQRQFLRAPTPVALPTVTTPNTTPSRQVVLPAVTTTSSAFRSGPTDRFRTGNWTGPGPVPVLLIR